VLEQRPDPDKLLLHIQESSAKQQRGKLKIFLGAAAGVGKTYAMLSEAQEQRARGIDVTIGYIETHKRRETEALITGLDQLPLKSFEYRGIAVREFDVDTAITRAPGLILVDELAHTNAPGSKHQKRWQDIEDLLHAGISVYTAVNVQHLESLNDIVAQITGVAVKETVPDAFFEKADEIEVVDIPPEELIQRLQEGKVYVPERIEHALEGFFKKGNLIALRELALRQAADRVDAQMQRFRAEQGVKTVWAARERILVCVAPNTLGTKVVRAAARLATASHAEMYAIYVESDRQASRSAEDQERARAALSLADNLGMHTVTLSGHDIAAEVLQYARQRNINLIVVGKPIKPRWREILFGSVVDEIVRRSGEINVHVLTEFEEEPGTRQTGYKLPSGTVGSYIATVLITAIATGISALMFHSFEAANLIMIYLLGVAIVANRFGPRESIVASVLSVLAFDFFFIEPRYTFAVADTQYLVTFGVMLIVAILISSLAIRLRSQASASTERERRTAALYTLSKELSKSRSKREICLVAAREIREVFNVDTAIFLFEKMLEPTASSDSGFERDTGESAVAQWCYEHNEPAGKGTNTLPSSRGYYVPLRGGAGAVGVLGILPNAEAWPFAPAQLNLLETFANGLGLAVERTMLAKESHEARIQAEGEKMRNALLSSISHDLRTPLTSIAGAASSLRDGLGDEKQLASTIYAESLRLNLQVQNLLDMTRLQSGSVQPKLEWHSLEEIVGTALDRTRDLINRRSVEVNMPTDLPLVYVDGPLMEKVVINLLENVVAHTPEDSSVQISARAGITYIVLDVADRGPGIPKGEETKIFERFFQRDGRREGGGFGLGLAICRTIMRLHDGQIWAENRRDGNGAVFHVEIPRHQQPEVPRG